MKQEPLNQAQQQKVTQNHNLIYQFLHHHNLAVEDWYDVAAIGFIKAVQHYDNERRAAFSSYAHQVMWNEVLQTLRKEKRSVSASGDDYEYAANHIASPIEVETCSIANLLLLDIVRLCRDESERQLVIRLIRQDKMQDICRDLGKHRTWSTKVRNRLRDTYYQQERGVGKH